MNAPAMTGLPRRLQLDVRTISCPIRHRLIFQQWDVLQSGDCFVLVNDHDPAPLKYQFDEKFPGAHSWEYLQKGPDVFQVKITKLKK